MHHVSVRVVGHRTQERLRGPASLLPRRLPLQPAPAVGDAPVALLLLIQLLQLLPGRGGCGGGGIKRQREA